MTDLLTAQSRTRGGSPSLSTRIQSHPALAPVLVGLLGLTISLIGIGIPSLWYDEAATVTAVMRDWPELWRMLGNVDAVHGAYYVVMHVLVDLFGYSPLLLRVPSAIAVGAAAALTVVLGRQLGLGRAAVVGGLVFCLLPRATWMGTEARSYALSTALAVLLTIVLLHAQRNNRRRWWLVYAVLTVVSCYFFIYLALVIVAHGVSLAWWLASARQAAVPTVRRWFVASAAAAVALLPFALAVIGQNAQVSWILDLGPDTPRQVLRTQWFLFDGRFAVAGWILIAFGAMALLRKAQGFSAAAVLLPALVVPTAALLVATELYSPLYTPRYLTMCLPFVALIIGAAIAAVPSRPLAALTLASLVLLAVPSIVEQRQPDAKQASTWNEVAALIEEQRAEDGPGTTAIIYGPVRYHATATSRVIAYTYPDAFEGTVDVTIDTPAATTGQLWETRNRLDESLDRLAGSDVAYLVTSVKRDRRESTTQTLATVGWSPTDEWNLSDTNVVRFERD